MGQEGNRRRETDGDEEKRSFSTLSSLREEKLRNESKCHGTENTPPSIPPSFPLCQRRAAGPREEGEEDYNTSQEAFKVKRQDSWRSPE